jgi:hypothetical protein
MTNRQRDLFFLFLSFFLFALFVLFFLIVRFFLFGVIGVRVLFLSERELTLREVKGLCELRNACKGERKRERGRRRGERGRKKNERATETERLREGGR